MNLTDPFTSMFAPRKMTDAELAIAIRLDIMSELDAMSLYQAHLEATDNEDAKRLLAHIMDEEKEHAAEFLELLKTLDPTEATELAEARANFIEAVGHAPEVKLAQAPEGANEGESGNQSEIGRSIATLTVGDMFRAGGTNSQAASQA